ncbi:MAG: 3-deoxy-manno-octulosonate cytidylyltransferase [Armatimonadetes bacterium JP3_11]|nr:MAG: 3-deoxy-manno-octulosonate cytidylyltransferase [Armatimonadetes bacterium CP1_7O]OYT75121.1 MAG: 3-deoxy-manno-octulosonate cytidylyltransferase [Armatimonadetes bacterium JP3_11]RMH07112.1 MAG: 3-deoxy-manno-octulosonate cytidylyltransferase [Armatimonadota bacterium]
MKVIGVIPARLAATRLPNKPLLDIAGKPMVQWVWERARQARSLHAIYIATPDPEIVAVAESFGAQAMLTSHAHRSGTDRMAEVARRTDGEIYVNIQGDEPLLNPEAIDRAVQPLLDDPSVMMSSLYCHAKPEDYETPSVVKVVVDGNGDALYFSRARIPYPRETTETPVLRHIGLYVFRKPLLLEYAQWEPTPLERTEMLEQLRVLEHGYKIRMVYFEHPSIAVDTETDLQRVRAILASGGSI